MCRFKCEISCLPAALVIWSSTAFIISFIIAMSDGHVSPLVPFISDTGANPPESCVFGLMVNISAFLGAFTMYVQYKMLQTLNEENPIISPYFNRAALVLGLLGSLGMCIVANFQETAVRVVHDIGALLTFGMGTLYLFLQTYISFKMQHLCNNRSAFLARTGLTAVSVVAFIIMLICYFLSGTSRFNWKPADEGYGCHVASAVCEWMVGFSFNFFFMTFIKDFQAPCGELHIPVWTCPLLTAPVAPPTDPVW
ncbi:DNA damage-regulated autophagy modulator protein 1 isoform X5 [Hypanus sabinus]|uniref:DNA damage-regulated autophagy modulator protein 1 isoform X5 n=1 Tax=Hypanus sabinus TaxID=79690 RepID=UPI0028C4C974|nr:DNA damage-regulated autophagy modulator protein 1 isoform X5 [Hypanus sabinus]